MKSIARMRPVQRPAPFDHPDWIFELKHDGFGALVYIRHGHCWLESKTGHRYSRFTDLAESICRSLNGRTAVLDGEIACLDRNGRSVFESLMRRDDEPYFIAYDLLELDGRDLRGLPLLERKHRLKRLLCGLPGRVLYLDHVKGKGKALFELVCKMDLEGIVAKWGKGTYDPSARTRAWVKIKNPRYSQKEGRRELFDRYRTAS